MPKRRDFITDILDRKSRHPKQTSRWNELMNRIQPMLFTLHHVLTKAPKKYAVRTELLRYFPTAIVAISEGYFQMAYRDLIDFGDPYLRNAANFKDLSLGHEAIYAIHGRQTTVGEIIAHQLSHNSLGDITRNMDALTGGDFTAAIREDLLRQTKGAIQETITTWVPQFVVRAFELRHIFCHELATKFTPSSEEVDQCFRAYIGFLFCSETYVQTLLSRAT